MAYTKAQIIEAAFAELGVGVSAFDLTAEERQAALGRADAMVRGWEAKGIRLGWTAGGLDDDSGLRDTDAEAVWLNLAVRLAPGFGKTPAAATATIAADTYRDLLTRAVTPGAQEMRGGMPLGAGFKSGREGRVFNPTPVADPLADIL